MYADMYMIRLKVIQKMALIRILLLRIFQTTGHVQFAVLEQKAFHLNKSKNFKTNIYHKKGGGSFLCQFSHRQFFKDVRKKISHP